jgi:proteasome lid subunit RPN8/RPN11/molybdopterin converting factor small subunit
MTVHVRLSTTLRARVPGYDSVNGLTLSPELPTTAGELAKSLNLPLSEIKIVVLNGRRVGLEAQVDDGDRVSYFPAIGGGGPAKAVRLPGPVRERLAQEGALAYPREACGFLLGSAANGQALCQGLVPGPAGTEAGYSLSAEELFAAEEAARLGSQEVLGFYHSHPDGEAEPSEADHADALPGYAYAVLAVGTAGLREVRFFRLDEATGRLAEI